MSTSAPLFHPEPARQANVAQAALSAAPGSDSWKQELNARLREHRQRRADSGTAADRATQNSSAHPGRSDAADRAGSPVDRQGSPAARVAARVAERYSNAPSYQQLLAAASAAAAAAAESAAEAAYEAHAAAQAVLSEWADSRDNHSQHDSQHTAQHDDFWTDHTEADARDRSSDHLVNNGYQASRYESSIGTSGENFNDHADRAFNDSFNDPFDDPFFTTPARAFEHGQQGSADSYPHNDFQRADRVWHESASYPDPQQLTIEHPQPLPPRTPIPTRRMVVDRARSLVDAFAEAVVPAAQSLPAKLIEFPRELVAPRKQRPRLAEGPLFEQESPSVALRIFEVAGHVEGAGADTAAQSTGTAYAAAATMRADTVSQASAYAPAGQMSRSSGYEDGDHAMVNRNRFDGEDSGEEAVPRRRGGFLFGPDTPSRSQKQSAQQTGWGSIRLGEHPAPAPIDPHPLAHESLENPDNSGDGARYGKSSPYDGSASTPAHAASAARSSRNTRPAARAEANRETSAAHASDLDAPPLHGLAPLSDRCMSALVDGTIVVSCFLLSLLVFTACTTHPPTGKGALAAAFVVLGALATFYAWLFMTYGGGSTPGMRYARIALCSFADDNPTRKELQNRIPATALALLPLGLGLLWALMDEDKLGWHDRMTRTYQRSYR